MVAGIFGLIGMLIVGAALILIAAPGLSEVPGLNMWHDNSILLLSVGSWLLIVGMAGPSLPTLKMATIIAIVIFVAFSYLLPMAGIGIV